MRTYLIQKDEAFRKVEVTDDFLFAEDMKIILPLWGKSPFIVIDVVFSADMQGDMCSLAQNVYVKKETQS